MQKNIYKIEKIIMTLTIYNTLLRHHTLLFKAGIYLIDLQRPCKYYFQAS